MNNFNEKCKAFLFELGKKERKYNIITVSQSIEDFKKPDFIVVKRTYEHRYMSNNWLKLHHKPMRRKPFKKMPSPLIDEAWMINTQNAITVDFFSKDLHHQNGVILGQLDPGRPVEYYRFRKNLERGKYEK